MHRAVHKRFGDIIEQSGVRPRRALEVGGRLNRASLLRFPQVAQAERYCVNLEKINDADGITAISGNANNMPMFEDRYFDLVVCNATLEHDPFFWRSLSEMRRVLKPSGMLIIGVPGFVKGGAETTTNLPRASTLTFEFHMKSDYYRFTPMAVRDVFFEGFDRVEVETLLQPPRLIGYGWKPREGSVTQTQSSNGAELFARVAGRFTLGGRGARRP